MNISDVSTKSHASSLGLVDAGLLNGLPNLRSHFYCVCFSDIASSDILSMSASAVVEKMATSSYEAAQNVDSNEVDSSFVSDARVCLSCFFF
jgi:hypothetical protein